MILALIIHDRGNVEETSFQGLTMARGLADSLDTELHTVILGADIEGLAEFGVSVSHQITHDGLDDYAPAAWGSAIAQLMDSIQPSAVISTGTERGNEVMAHIGAIKDLPTVANVVDVDPTNEMWEISRTRWGGSLIEQTTLEAPVKLLTVTEHIVEAAPAANPVSMTTQTFIPGLDDSLFVTKVVDRAATTDGVTLATAPVVVSGGRGVGSPEGFAPLEELAAMLGGVVGCSRVVTNSGWRPHSDQVGQTGTVIAPDLYIACGISGAIQHWVGMMASKTILAINTDAEAPMVTKADYAVVGDLHEILPAIVAEVKARIG